MKFNKLIPELSVSDFKTSLTFYKMLGFKVEYTRKDFAFINLKGSQLMIQQDNAVWKTAKLVKPFGRGVNFQIEVKNIDAFVKKITQNKLYLKFPLEEHEYLVKGKKIKQKEFLLEDPDGYLLRFCE